LYAYCLEEYTQAVQSFSYPQYDICVVDNSKNEEYAKKVEAKGLRVLKDNYRELARDRIIHSRNMLRQKVVDEGYDYLLSLEQDVIPPKDVIERLLALKQPVVSGLYFNLNNAHEFPNLLPGTRELPLAYRLFAKEEATKPVKEQQLRRLTKEEVQQPKKILVRMAGLGCVLIHRRVLEKIEFGYYSDTLHSDDRKFYDDVTTLKIPIVIDTSIKCQHLVRGRMWDWSNIKK